MLTGSQDSLSLEETRKISLHLNPRCREGLPVTANSAAALPGSVIFYSTGSYSPSSLFLLLAFPFAHLFLSPSPP